VWFKKEWLEGLGRLKRYNIKKSMGSNFTQKQLEKFRKDHMDKSRLPRGLVEALFERLKTTVDTTNMDAHGLS
jgi:hypothetical protein